MDLIDRIKEIAGRIPKQIEHIQTEEATKTAFIMPFINALGYDIFNPMEVIPEFTADIGTKKGEKVDYAIKKDENIVMLIECKWCGNDIEGGHISQLTRYFSVTETRFGIVTNGIIYKFFSDIEETNKMDGKPFFVFNVLDFEEHHIDELKKFTKSAFDLEDILTTASTLKYTGAIKKIFAQEIVSPSDDFVKYFASQVYSGVKTQTIISQFSKIVKDALNQFIRERINDRLKSALNDERENDVTEKEDPPPLIDDEKTLAITEDETNGYNIVKAIISETVDINRVFIRNTKAHCGILLDDNNRKTICRLRFKASKKKYLGIVKQKNETKHLITNVNDIYNYSDEVKDSVLDYLEKDNNPPSSNDTSLKNGENESLEV